MSTAKELQKTHADIVRELNLIGIDKFCDKYNLVAKQHIKYPELYLFTYHVMENFDNPIKRFCRGVILNSLDNWSIVNFTYEKFFNYGEPLAADIDWESARVFDKADGSIIQMFKYNDTWNIATSGTPDANAQVQLLNKSFRFLFWQTWDALGYKLPDNSENLSLAFELISKYNENVVNYDQPNILLHGVRKLDDLTELDPIEYAKEKGWDYVKCHNFASLDEAVKSANSYRAFEHEGYVVCDKYFNRIKIKSEEYIEWHHLVSNPSEKSFVEIIQKEEVPEVLSYKPKFKEDFDRLYNIYDSLSNKLENEFNQYNNIKDQKEFALAIKHLPYQGLFFSKRSGKISTMKEGLSQMRIKNLMKLMGLKE